MDILDYRMKNNGVINQKKSTSEKADGKDNRSSFRSNHARR
jgi:hypothetical protein